MHCPSVSSCGISPRCQSARSRVVQPPAALTTLSRPSSGAVARPTSSSRPPSGSTSVRRVMETPVTWIDVKEQRDMLMSQRMSHAAAAHGRLPHGAFAHRQHHGHDDGGGGDDAPEWSAPSKPVSSLAAAAMPVKPSDGFAASALRALQEQASHSRRVSKIPTPPPQPSMAALLGVEEHHNGLMGRRISVFPNPGGELPKPLHDTQNHMAPVAEASILADVYPDLAAAFGVVPPSSLSVEPCAMPLTEGEFDEAVPPSLTHSARTAPLTCEPIRRGRSISVVASTTDVSKSQHRTRGTRGVSSQQPADECVDLLGATLRMQDTAFLRDMADMDVEDDEECNWFDDVDGPSSGPILENRQGNTVSDNSEVPAGHKSRFIPSSQRVLDFQRHQQKLADQRQRQRERLASYVLTRDDDLLSNNRMAADEMALNSELARRRAFTLKLHDAAMVHAGVQLTIPNIPQLPHYLSLHPSELMCEVDLASVPTSLRIRKSACSAGPPESDTVSRQLTAPRQGTLDALAKQLANRGGGFLSVAALKREARSTNFVMPPCNNAGPLEPVR